MGEGVMVPDENKKYPKILVISSNCFSETTNNGKTLASFFDKYPVENIAQLYFNPEVPENLRYCNYFRITDKDILKCILRKDNICGTVFYQKDNLEEGFSRRNTSVVHRLKKYNITRIIREILWKTDKWKNEALNQWLDNFSPEIIFLCAGDGGFAYDITKYIQNKLNAKLVVYITDDYVLPRKTLSPFWWLRRNFILKKMRNAVQESDLFITISEIMKKEYYEMFGKDSIIAVNMTESMRDETISIGNIGNKGNNNDLTLVYAGGLHYKRYITLNLLAQSLKKYNGDPKNKQKAYLNIYSGQEPSSKVLKCLNIEGASKFCGKLNSKELKEELNCCDIPVHVESFNKKSIESTRLSISTKIPEYLSIGKPVLAIGPHQVASMEYLKDSAYCITNKHNIYKELKRLFNNNELLDELARKSLLKYEQNHKNDIIANQFIKDITSVYERKSDYIS
jgi:hypothetical protein